MGVFDIFFSRIKAAVGYQQTFEDKVKAGDVGGALGMMELNEAQVNKAIKEYRVEQHEIMQRQDKPIFDSKTGRFKGWVKRWRLPLNYATYINEIALVFLYGRPVQWLERSEGTENAYSAFTDFIRDKHFNSKLREAKRLAGAETRSALLFHCFQNKDGKADCLIKTLAKSLGDDIYVIKDQFDRLVYFARGYNLSEAGGKSRYHVDIYTDDVIYHCVRANMGWQVTQERNFIGKKPVILFEQDVEWAGAQPLMDRQEYMKSRTADVNDYMADPALVATADVVQGMPDKDSENKLYVLSEKGDMKYLVPDTANELKKQETDDNEKHIFRETFTPKIDFETMTGLSNVSAKALKQMMVLADIKAQMRKETHDGYLTRIGNLIRAIIGNVLDSTLKTEADKLRLEFEYQEPFGEDVTEAIANAVKLYNADALSQETLVELNPLIRDKEQEKNRIAAENAVAEAKALENAQRSIFEPTA